MTRFEKVDRVVPLESLLADATFMTFRTQAGNVTLLLYQILVDGSPFPVAAITGTPQSNIF